MGPHQAHTDRGWDGSSTALADGSPEFRFAGATEAGEAGGRHEPQRLVERIVPRDSYASWLEQREADRQRERECGPQIRWVHRPRSADGRAIVARRL